MTEPYKISEKLTLQLGTLGTPYKVDPKVVAIGANSTVVRSSRLWTDYKVKALYILPHLLRQTNITEI